MGWGMGSVVCMTTYAHTSASGSSMTALEVSKVVALLESCKSVGSAQSTTMVVLLRNQRKTLLVRPTVTASRMVEVSSSTVLERMGTRLEADSSSQLSV